MIISLEEAQSISKDITEDDVLALQNAIIAYTNNKFRTGISTNIIQIDESGLKVDAPDMFLAGDLIEVEYSTFEDGISVVKEVSNTHIKIDLSGRGSYPIDEYSGAKVHLIVFPLDVKIGAMDILRNKVKAMTKAGIKSESVGRMSVTYANVTDSQDSVYGLDAAYFSFLDPYRKFNWT